MENMYPKWLYHAEKEAVLVVDHAAHRALGAGWYESPAEIPASAAEKPAAAKRAEAPKSSKKAYSRDGR